MVIIRTSATEVIIQAVSPALGVHFSSTANFGSALPAQAGGRGISCSRGRGGFLGVGAVDRRHAQEEGEENPQRESQKPRTGWFLERHGSQLLSLDVWVRGY